MAEKKTAEEIRRTATLTNIWNILRKRGKVRRGRAVNRLLTTSLSVRREREES